MDGNLLMWLLLLSLLIGSCYWHRRENARLARKWKKSMDPASAQWMIRFVWTRSIEFLAVIACSILILIIYDLQLDHARQTIADLSKPAPTCPPPAETTAKTVTPQTTPPITVTAAAPSPALAQPQPESETTAVEDIYNPEEKTAGIQAKMDILKKRYEDILVTFLFLEKCNRVNSSDYHVITSALSQEMASINAPGRLQNDILTAARGSYKEMYSQSKCDGTSIDSLQSQYSNYINTITQEFGSP